MAKTRREFTPKFKREAVALLQSSGRPLTQIAAELGIQPLMLRSWRSAQNGGPARSRVTGPGAGPSAATPAAPSPADQAAEVARLRRELDRVRMERDIVKGHRHLLGDAAMKFRFVAEHAKSWPVRAICRVLGVSPSGYYAWHDRPDSARTVANRQLLADLRRLHADHHGRYGSPCMHAALRAEGRTTSRGRVERLMRASGLRASAARRFRPATTDSRHSLPVAPNLLEQRFEAAAPNQVWLADITYLPTGEGWLHLAAVLDLATRKVVGWFGTPSHMCDGNPRCASTCAPSSPARLCESASSSAGRGAGCPARVLVRTPHGPRCARPSSTCLPARSTGWRCSSAPSGSRGRG